jgi:hypothetical protein
LIGNQIRPKIIDIIAISEAVPSAILSDYEIRAILISRQNDKIEIYPFPKSSMIFFGRMESYREPPTDSVEYSEL